MDFTRIIENIIAELQQESNALRSKIKDLEASSNTLTINLEESYKKLSEVTAEIVIIKSEKDILSGKLNRLNFEYHELSEKIAQQDVNRDNFQREINNLQEKLTENVQENLQFQDMENEIGRLLDLVNNAIQESDHPAVPSDGSAIKSLELLLKILVDRYINLVAEKSMPEDSTGSVPKDAMELVCAANQISTSNSELGDVPHNIAQELSSMRVELDNAISNLNLLTDEKNEFMERCLFLSGEIEAISRQQESLKEEMATEIEKNKLLSSQLDVICNEKNAMREHLTQEEEKSASIREKLNIAVRKGKGLVQQRDGLKEEIEKMNIMITHLNSERNRQVEALESEKEILENQFKETVQHLANTNQTLIVSAEQEAKKSKRTAELLLAELNEVQERTDILQEEIGKAEAALFEAYKRKDATDWFMRDFDLLSHVEAFMEFIETGKDFKSPVNFPADNPLHEVNFVYDLSNFKSHGPTEGCNLTYNLAFGVECVLDCLSEFNDLKIKLQKQSFSLAEQTSHLVKNIDSIRDAEAVVRSSTTELESAKAAICSLEKQVEAMINDKKSLELRVSELSSLEVSLDELNRRVKPLNDALTAKDQEIETLKEALDEEEMLVERLENRNKELRSTIEEKTNTLENLEASHEKTLAKLSTTVNKFDQLYNLSESLVAEVENLQSQLQSRESDISFLRQEVTRCTNELLASQGSNKRHLSGAKEFLKWLNMTISRLGLIDIHMNGDENQIHAFTNILDKSITSIMAELEDLRAKVSQQMKMALPGRKFNNDQIAISIDVEKGKNIIDDDDDDKGFLGNCPEALEDDEATWAI
ncbi:protein MLP1-like [Zingiber officinale]|uniref:protein MLP1-like n=1 Tax=Zingiber officinale TaxID=94328 RepID=UPI001C4ADDAA|nr:protein MLP1-like [Zingiber officinale]